MAELYEKLPAFLSADSYTQVSRWLPEYDKRIRNAPEVNRLMALNDIYQIYVPSAMSVEIYHKLYLSAVRSLGRKKGAKANIQRANNYRTMNGGPSKGILGGADSFTIIGPSGIGKTSAIMQAVCLSGGDGVMESKKPFMRLVLFLNVQCPHDSSIKGVLLETLRQVDVGVGSNYYEQALKNRSSTDTLIGMVSQALLNHVGVLIIDEIQNIRLSKNGLRLVAVLMQLINTTGVPICMVGTPEVKPLLESQAQMARRSVGLEYGPLPLDDYFHNFCRILFGFQYTAEKMNYTQAAVSWLYEHSAGLPAIVVGLWHDAQEISITSKYEKMDFSMLKTAYNNRLNMMNGHILVKKGRSGPPSKSSSIAFVGETRSDVKKVPIEQIVREAKDRKQNVRDALSEHITVEEVNL